MPRIRPPKRPEAEIEIDDPTPPTEEIIIELSDDELDSIPPLPGGDPTLHQPDPATNITVTPETPDDALRTAIEAQQRAEELQRQYQRERDEAIRQAAEHQAELTRANDDRATAEYARVLTGIAAEESTIQKAEADYANAMQMADYGAAAKAQREMATAASRLDRLQIDKTNIDQQKETTRTQPTQIERRTVPASVVEQIDIMPVPAEAKVWLRQHPELVSDPSKNKRLGSLHGYLIDVKNIVPFSKEYFDELDSNLGFRKEPVTTTQPAAPAASQPRRSMPVTAPVTRDVPTSSGQRQSSASQMTLTAEERYVARNSFSDIPGQPPMTNAEKERLYAINKAKLARERASGRYPERERA